MGTYGNGSHTRIVPSSDPEMMCSRPEEKAMEFTEPACPSRGLAIAVPVAASQIRMVRSEDPEMMWCPSGE